LGVGMRNKNFLWKINVIDSLLPVFF